MRGGAFLCGCPRLVPEPLEGLAAQKPEHFAVLGEAARLCFRVDGRAVDEHVELPLVARFRNRVEAVCVQLVCETRSAYVIPASGGAIEDLDGHQAKATDPVRSS